VRLVPPLIATISQIDDAIAIIDSAAQELGAAL